MTPANTLAPSPTIQIQLIGITDEPIERWPDDLALGLGEVGAICVRGPVGPHPALGPRGPPPRRQMQIVCPGAFLKIQNNREIYIRNIEIKTINFIKQSSTLFVDTLNHNIMPSTAPVGNKNITNDTIYKRNKEISQYLKKQDFEIVDDNKAKKQDFE